MAYDFNTMFFNSAVSAAATSEVMDYHGPDMDEVDYRIVALGNVSGNFTPALETSDDNENFEVEKEFSAITEAGETHNKYRCKKRYRRVKLTGSGSIEKLMIGMDDGARYTWREPAAEEESGGGNSGGGDSGGGDPPII